MTITKKSIAAKKTAKSSPVKSKSNAGTLANVKKTASKVVAAQHWTGPLGG